MFSNIAPDLTLPPGAPLTPGSGTVYIGSAQLSLIPGLNIPDYKSAIVWFADAAGLASGVDYWFMAHFTQGVLDGVRWGYYPTGGPATIAMSSVYGGPGGKINIVESPNLVLMTGRNVNLQSRDTTQGGFFSIGSKCVGTGAIELYTPNGNVVFTDATAGAGAAAIIDWNSVGAGAPGPVIRSFNNGVAGIKIDVWQTFSSVQTIAGVANCTCTFNWRVTIDRVVEVRVFVQMNGAPLPAVPTFGQFNCPTVAQGFPVIDVSTTGQGPHLVGIYNTAVVQGALGCRIDPGAPAPFYFFNTPAGVVQLEMSGTFTIAK